jgi:sodium transport system permease protein
MTRAVRIVFAKELLENLRDRRVILSAFLFGVLLAPVIFGLTTSLASKRVVESQDKPLRLTVSGHEHAPNLVHFLEENGAEVKTITMTPDEAMRAVRSGGEDLVLLIDAEYGEKLQAGESAPLDLVVDTANNQTGASAERARRLLEGYGSQLAALRLLVRGISPEVVQPVDVRTLDVATPAGRSLLILGMMTYFSFMSMLVGGFYLAIDTTAGERERKSLEPLLTLPVSRTSLLLGKMAATILYMLAALALTLVAFVIVMQNLPLEKLAMTSSFGLRSAVTAFLVLCPVAPFGAALMTLVASFTRTYREAQTYISFMLIVPTLPAVFAAVLNVEPSAKLMWIPSLSQHLLVTTLIKAQPLDPLLVALSAGTTLAFAAVLGWIALKLYRREAILG